MNLDLPTIRERIGMDVERTCCWGRVADDTMARWIPRTDQVPLMWKSWHRATGQIGHPVHWPGPESLHLALGAAVRRPYSLSQGQERLGLGRKITNHRRESRLESLFCGDARWRQVGHGPLYFYIRAMHADPATSITLMIARQASIDPRNGVGREGCIMLL